MKKTLLLFLLLPFLGISQSDLVKWNAANSNQLSPTYVNANVNSQNVTPNGVSLTYTYYNDTEVFFQTGDWQGAWPNPAQNGGEYDPSKYIQFTIKPNTGYKADLSNFIFQVRSGSGKFRVKYSKDASFATGVKDLMGETASSSSWTTYNPSFSTEINPVLSTETVYVRIYSYSTYNTFDIKTGTLATNVVPVIRGTVTAFDSSKILAINDYVDTKKGAGVNISPLSNDVQGGTVTSLTLTSLPTAAEGTALMNPDRTITFNPAKNFTGTSTFNYTITGPTGTSNATIKVTVADNTDSGLSLWNGAANSFSPVTNSLVNSNSPITATGASLNYVYENTTSAFFQTGSWPTPQDNGGGISLNKYIQFKINPANTNAELTLKQFNFTFRGPTNQKFQVRYSKSATFATGVKTLVAERNGTGGWTAVSANFDTDTNPVKGNETVYIRFYVYNTNNTFELLNGNGNSVGPVITGTARDLSTLTANDDSFSTPVNQAITIPVLDNDIIGNSAIQAITVTQPTNGTVTVNGTTSVTFTPSSSFTGTTSFTYTLRNANSKYSSATVGVAGMAPLCAASLTPGTNYWKGYVYTYTGNTPMPTTFVGTVAEKPIFTRDINTGVIIGDSSVEADSFCGTQPSDKFFVRYLMNTTTAAGIHNFTIGADDGVRLYIDGSLVPVSPTNSWGDHSYITYAAQVNLTAGAHSFILEYYENAQASKVSFSYGMVQGDRTLPFGINQWNVYGFTLADITLPAVAYAGVYVDTKVDINTQTYWGRTVSPSAYSGWQGAPIGVDQFAITYKRQGFPCGYYQIQLVNCDDVAQIYLDGNLIFTQNGYTNTASLINSGTLYPLNKNSRIEVRLREDAGDANLAIKFIDNPVVYDGNTAPPAGYSMIVNDNVSLKNNVEVCSCTVAANKTLTVPTGKVLTVNENVTIATGGKLLIANGGSLMQTNKDAVYAGNNTSFELQRITNPIRRDDYVYWSSPVTLASGYTLKKLSPATASNEYYRYDPVNGWISVNNGALTMTPGAGYIVSAPTTYYNSAPQNYSASFTGMPNNGDINITPVATKFNLIGNPYPSTLSAVEFIKANTQAGNETIVGSLYFWTHNTLPENTDANMVNRYYYTSNDYAVFNLSGSVVTSKSATSEKAPGANAPSGNIASGQGFFVKALTNNPIKYTNDMRVGANNTQFFKTASTSNGENGRVWLNLTNDEGAFKQMLVGYIEDATNGYDNNFDATSFNGNAYIDFYSINESKKLTIQGRALPFTTTDEIPLAYKTTIAGAFTISIDHVDGLLTDQAIYVEDKVTGTINDLRAGDYTFKTEVGTFADRFVLRYRTTNKATLGTGDFESTEKGLFVAVKDKTIKINSAPENIKEVLVYDGTGKLIYNKKKVEAAELQISNIQSVNQLLVVKVILEDDSVSTKKIILN